MFDDFNSPNKKIAIPHTGAVKYFERNYSIDPYVVGAFIGCGCMVIKRLTFTSSDAFIAQRCAKLIGARGVRTNPLNNSAHFLLKERVGKRKFINMDEVFGALPEMLGKYSTEKVIPEYYKYGSLEQRTALIQGLFDTNAYVGCTKYLEITYHTSSEKLAFDVEEVLYSLGVRCRFSMYARDGNDKREYSLHLKQADIHKIEFFVTPKKINLGHKITGMQKGKPNADTVGIKNIVKTNIREPATDITIDDPEHLYQTEQYVVTHDMFVS
jgi:hypothetical protein